MPESTEPPEKPAGPRVERINFRIVGPDGDDPAEREVADLTQRVEMLRKAGQRLFDEAERLQLHCQRIAREHLIRKQNSGQPPD